MGGLDLSPLHRLLPSSSPRPGNLGGQAERSHACCAGGSRQGPGPALTRPPTQGYTCCSQGNSVWDPQCEARSKRSG